VLICLGQNVTVIDAFRAAEFFGINVLAADQQDLADRFARKGVDRFADVSWRRGKTGAPLIAGVVATLECSVRQRIPCGDHDIFAGEVVHSHVHHDGSPLLFYASGYRKLLP